MEASESERINFILKIIGVNPLRLGSFKITHIKSRVADLQKVYNFISFIISLKKYQKLIIFNSYFFTLYIWFVNLQAVVLSDYGIVNLNCIVELQNLIIYKFFCKSTQLSVLTIIKLYKNEEKQ